MVSTVKSVAKPSSGRRTVTKPSVSVERRENFEASGLFLKAYRTGIGAIESTVVGVAEIPLRVFSGLGLPDEATQTARDGQRKMFKGVNSTLDSVATQFVGVADKGAAQVVEVAGKGVSLFTGAVGGATKSITERF